MTRREQQQIAKTVVFYLSRDMLHDLAAGFDVIDIQWSAAKNSEPRLTHIPDAFKMPASFRAL